MDHGVLGWASSQLHRTTHECNVETAEILIGITKESDFEYREFQWFSTNTGVVSIPLPFFITIASLIPDMKLGTVLIGLTCAEVHTAVVRHKSPIQK